MNTKRVAEGIYRTLLYLYPRDFRRRFGEEMLGDFRALRDNGPSVTKVSLSLYFESIAGAARAQSRKLLSTAAVLTVVMAVRILTAVPQDGARTLVRAVAELEGVPVEVALAVVWVESNFDTAAVSPTGAIGLTQIQLQTARTVDPAVTGSKLKQPEYNLLVGLRYLRRLLEQHDDLETALAVYHSGVSSMQDPVTRQVGKKYAADVLRATRRFQ